MVPFFKPILTKIDHIRVQILTQHIHTQYFNMETTKQPTQPQFQTTTTQSIHRLFQYRDEEDFDLIGFAIASNGGRLSITQHK